MSGLTYLTLDELEALAFEFRSQGVSILAANDEWHLRVKIAGSEALYRAHKVSVAP